MCVGADSRKERQPGLATGQWSVIVEVFIPLLGECSPDFCNLPITSLYLDRYERGNEPITKRLPRAHLSRHR
eukprot:1654991-Prymnesium_polylepis.1